ncbi:MAG: hypothetical protein RJB26_1515 [Pseudomonadota bacterium]|jgi:hypothetical protein
MADSKTDNPAFPGAAPAVADGGIDRYGSWSGRPPASIERRRSQLVKDEEPVAARHGTLTRSLNNYVNFRVWTERARAQWDAPPPEPVASLPGNTRRR